MAKPKNVPAKTAPSAPPAPAALAWPADAVERRLVAALVPYARNARTHSPEQVQQIVASIREFGWTVPVLIDESEGIIAGHGRVMAALALGVNDIPVMVARGWSDEQKRAYIIADNKLALNAGWDTDLLRIELQELKGAGVDLALTGFTGDELKAALADRSFGLTDPDDAPPEDEANVVSRPGDVWLVGRHRLVCGDCTEAESVALALGDASPHLMVTDPPYGVNYDPAWRQRAGLNGPAAATGRVLNDHRADWREAWDLFPGAVAYIWHAGTFAGDVAASMKAQRFKLRAQIVWVKTRIVMGRGDYHHQHEPCFYAVREGEDENWHFEPQHEVASYAVREGETGRWHGGRKQSTVWFIEHLKSDTGHGTQKPIECMKRPIENNSLAGQSVYEPFSGSGTTLIACEMLGRICHALELKPSYVDVAVRRWQAFTGGAATLEGDGRSFDAVAAERLGAARAA